MGRLKQRHNWKARQNNNDSNFAKAADVPVEISAGKKAKYDESNIFVLPSKKQPIKKAKQKLETKKKILSRKQRKKLEKITEKKKKNLNRADLLKSLAQVQVEKEELQMMVSTSEMQTRGLKRHLMEPQKLIKNTTAEAKVNSIAGRNKKRKEIVTSLQQDSSSDDDEDDDNDDDMNDNNDDDDDDDDDRSETESHSLDINKELSKEQPAKADLTPNSSLVHSNKCEKIASQEKQQMSGEKTKPARIPAIHVPVFRTQEIEEARSMLPIITEEQSIMEAINENPVVIICGETGSGKTTQVPQFLFEAGYTSNGKQIGITEPRRVAAISMSQRVAAEMNLSSNEVSYQIRFEGNTTPQTKIKFMTDGVLLKEVEKDFLLTKYSAVIIDEAHERSMFSDILIGLLSRIVPLREKKGVPLKLIIMSATLRVEDFINNKKLFKKNPCVIQVKSRQYPVSIHFNKVTPMEDYLGEAFRKVCKIHQKLPDGGILVFVTGQQEVHQLSHRLRRCFPFNKHKNYSLKKDKEVQNIGGSEEIRYSKPTKPSVKLKKRKKEGLVLPEINLDDYAVTKPLEAEEDHESELEELNSDDDIESETYQGSYTSQPMYVLPLFSLLSSKDQAKVFSPPPPGSRLCVIATNVAETSLTIPHIKYVVDTGKVKTRVYDKITGISTFIITWTSKASANQRAGRAGRTGAGHCYRLFSSAVFSNDFENYSKPEIQRKPVDDLVLQMKHMNIDQVVNFPFPSPPDEETLKAAEKRLQLLGALEPLPKNLRLKACIEKEWCSRVTSLGHAMATFPIAPCYAKMLALGNQHDLLLYVICLVSALSVQEVLLENLHSKQTEEKNIQRRKWMQIRQTWVGQGNSLLLGDIMVLLKAIGAAQFANCSIGFCESHGLNQKAVLEVNKLQVQLTNIVNNVLPNANLSVNTKLQPPSDLQAKLLRQIILAGLPNHVARKISESEITDAEERVKLKGAYKSLEVDKPIFFNPTSVLRRELPEFVVYQELFETKKIFMRGVTAIEVEWLPIYAPGLCSFSKPLEQPPPYYDKESGQIMCYMSSTFGPHCWPIEAVSLPYPHGLDKFKHIAYFFLDGQIFPKLGKFKKVLLSSPSTMLKTWARLQSRTETLLHALVEKEIDSRDKFLSEWQKDKLYLLPSYKEWIPEAVHTEVDTMWPPV